MTDQVELHIMRLLMGLLVAGVVLFIGGGLVLVISVGWWIPLAALATLAGCYVVGFLFIRVVDGR